MEFLTSFSLEIVVAVVLILTIVLSAFRNQNKVIRNTICLLFAFAIVGIPLYFNYRNITTIIIGFFNQYIFPYTANGFQLDTVEFNGLLTMVLIFAGVFILYGILVGLCVLIGGTDKRKYHNRPDYTTPHVPEVGVIFGIIKALVFIYAICIFYCFLTKAFAIDTSNSWLINLFKQFDPIAEKFQSLIEEVLGV